MSALKLYKSTSLRSSFLAHHPIDTRINISNINVKAHRRTKLALRASVEGQEGKKTSERRSFLTLEEAGLVEMSGLASHEGFLCRLTLKINTMSALKLCKSTSLRSSFLAHHPIDTRINISNINVKAHRRTKLSLRASVEGQEGKKTSERRSFLTLEEAGLVEMSGLASHEGFLCRLTISSLNLLKVIAEQEECSIEELNAGRVCDWFVKDKLKREQNLDCVLEWNESDFVM
ncbi:hypothetical protein CTI12_AA453390 [Artemisia annua]|uniref:Uncharacterized protein n=1 Tax=Artemisia annua TaxID=35608 RepID=A0A2U1LU69_ARTAN|nr:hypothetical protein CTI12_AA453390 [Artemisia annua]